jgi:hypothetical protein
MQDPYKYRDFKELTYNVAQFKTECVVLFYSCRKSSKDTEIRYMEARDSTQ